MKASKQAQRDAKQLFQACLVDGALDEDRARAAAAALAEKKPRGYHGIMAHFQKLVQMDVDKRTANVSSAIALDDKARHHIKANLTKNYGENVQINFLVDEGLIGGLRVQIGSDVYDGSVRTRLNTLNDSF